MKLIVINGASGIGKSTVAKEIQKELPESLLLEVDVLRRSIEGYREHKKESAELSYKHVLAISDEHLKTGYSVIIDKAIFNADWFLNDLADLALKYNAGYFEFILIAEKQVLITRANDRGFNPGSLLTPEKVVEMWEKSHVLITKRPNAIVIDTTVLSLDEVITKVKEVTSL